MNPSGSVHERRRRVGAGLTVGVGVGVGAILAACGSSSMVSARRIAPAEVPRILSQRTVAVDTVERRYSLFVPAAAPTRPALLVLAHLYGVAQPSPRLRSPSDGQPMFDAARRNGVAIAMLQGTGFSFNAGACCGNAARQDVDDVGFVDAAIRDAVDVGGVDPDRVYLVGFSNGGFLAYRYACQRPTLIRGIAVVEGALITSDCAPQQSVDVLMIHQSGDPVVPLAGSDSAPIPGDAIPLPGAKESLRRYRVGIGCSARGRSFHTRRVAVTDFSCPRNRLRLMVTESDRHTLPQQPEGLDGAAAIMKFFGLQR